jgi:hypothetical protein
LARDHLEGVAFEVGKIFIASRKLIQRGLRRELDAAVIRFVSEVYAISDAPSPGTMLAVNFSDPRMGTDLRYHQAGFSFSQSLIYQEWEE